MKPGDEVLDRVQLHDPDEEAGRMVVLEMRDDISPTVAMAGERSLQAVAGDWHTNLAVPDDYNSAEDTVVWTAFVRALEIEFGDAWRSWTPDVLRRKCASPDCRVRMYTYHRERLIPAVDV